MEEAFPNQISDLHNSHISAVEQKSQTNNRLLYSATRLFIFDEHELVGSVVTVFC